MHFALSGSPARWISAYLSGSDERFVSTDTGREAGVPALPGERWDVFCALPPAPKTILDVGCGQGLAFQRYRARGTRVIGVDSDSAALEQALQHVDEVHLLDIEADAWPGHFRGAFDVIAFCDCLEHLRDPWTVLRSVIPLLQPGGLVVASIPNIRQWRLLAKIAVGRFDYVKAAGTIQREHLRFFTRRTIVDMFAEAGYERPRFYFPRRTFHLRPPERLVNTLTRGALSDLLYGSYTVSASPFRV